MTSHIIFGLDIGTSSVGWAVIDTHIGRILGRGVRKFNMPNAAADRRIARSNKRRNGRKHDRKQAIRRLFVKHQWLPSHDHVLDALSSAICPYEARAAGLDRLLTPQELAKALYHIATRRGFQSNRRMDAAQTEEEAKEHGKIQAGIDLLKQKQSEGGYRTIGETLAKHPDFLHHKRNRDSYAERRFIQRDDLRAEVKLLFERQRALGNPLAHLTIESAIFKLAFDQLPYAERDVLYAQVGYCTYFPLEKRAPKNSPTHEQFVIWNQLNNLRIQGTKGTRGLTDLQKEQVIQALNKQKKGELTYKQVRSALQLSKTDVFLNIASKAKDPETSIFLRNAFTQNLYQAIQSLNPAPVLTPDQLDDLTLELSLCKEADQLHRALSKKGYAHDLIEALIPLHPAGFGHLSLRAIRQLLPLIQQGISVTEAATQLGWQTTVVRKPSLPLAPIPSEFKNNRVVLRALTQARKVLQAMIRSFGEPDRIHLELARDLSRSAKERKQIAEAMDKRSKEKKKISDEMQKTIPYFFNRKPQSQDVLKFESWHQQNGVCPYTDVNMDLKRVFSDQNYAEMDHVQPFSRTFDNRHINQVLCMASANREKGNRTPFEWLGGTPRWDDFVTRIQQMKFSVHKRNHLQAQEIPENAHQYEARLLNDTRYIAKTFKAYIEEHVPMKSNHVLVVNGQLTDWLRTRYGLGKLKDRSKDEHHALDAILIALASPSLVQQIAKWSKRNELHAIKHGEAYVDPETGEIIDHAYRTTTFEKHIPNEWAFFREEVLCWFGIHPYDASITGDPKTLIQSVNLPHYQGLTEKDWARVTPLHVSRMEIHKVTAKAHQDTIARLREVNQKTVQIKRISVSDLVYDVVKKYAETLIGKKADKFKPHADHLTRPFTEEEAKHALDRLYGDDQNVRQALHHWFTTTPNLLQAIRDQQLPRKTAKNGNGPVIQKVKTTDGDQVGRGVYLHEKAFAMNKVQLCGDVFWHESTQKYAYVPMYPGDFARSELPDWMAVTGTNNRLTDDHRFCFRIFKDDLIHYVSKNQDVWGYVKKVHATNATLMIEPINGGEPISMGIVTATSITKHRVDLLGNISGPVREQRMSGQAFPKKRNQTA